MQHNATQLSLSLQPTGNAFLIDGALLEALVSRLKHSYDPDALSDLCGLLVQFVLRDRAYIVHTPSAHQPFVHSLTKGELAFYFRHQSRLVGSKSPEKAALRKHGFAAIAPLVAASANSGLPIFAWGPAHHAIEALAPRRIEQAICDLERVKGRGTSSEG